MGVAFQHGGPPCKVCHQSPHLKKALAPADYVSIMQVEEEDSLVCVLLDEVESLTRARSAAVSGSEPADAIRAVNALLTQVLSLQDPVVASASTLPGMHGNLCLFSCMVPSCADRYWLCWTAGCSEGAPKCAGADNLKHHRSD